MTFYEEVDEAAIYINLTDGMGALWGLEMVGSNNPTFVYRPLDNLKEGDYTVKARARDKQGILGPVIELNFPIIIPDLVMGIIEPSFWVTSIGIFDLEIETDRNADCSYSFTGFGNLYNFDLTGGQRHEKEDISIGGSTSLYIQCTDEYGKTYQKTGQLILDQSNPTISASADDVTEEPLETTLVVNADEKVICKFDYESTIFEDMQEFDGYNISNEDSYTTNPQQLFDGLIDGKVYTLFVECIDKAGRLSNSVQVSFSVDTSQPETVTINHPKGTLSDNILRFNVSTNKDADFCQYTGNSDKTGFVTFSGKGKTHISSDLGALEDGTYTYYVKCRFSGPLGTFYVDKSTSFTIDSSKPSMLYVDMLFFPENETGKTYKDDELCAEWKAEDNESSISLYSYYVYWDKSTDELITEGTKSPVSDNEYCVGVELNDSEKYYFKVSAQNSVGLWSDNKTSSSIQVDTSLAPAGCDNNRKDNDETDVDCGGECEGCADGKNCLLNSDCDSKFCNASNKCTNPRCDDGVKNGAETDVDCGGDCKNCDVDKYCNENKDCKTNNCDASTGKCAEILDVCENGKFDLSETDIDCGGSNCPGCGVGKSCDSDSDCITTAECKNGVCTLRLLDSDGDGVFDDEDNCPEIANEDQADVDDDGVGDRCDLDSDNDGLPDSFEQQYFDCVTCAEPGDDPDKDGLTNLDEYSYNTNPMKGDTDADGYSDKEEIDEGTDPLDPSSHPGGGFLKYLLMVLGLAVLGGGGYFGYKMFMEKKPKSFIPPKAPVAKRMVRRPMVMPRRPMTMARRPTAPMVKHALVTKSVQIKPPIAKKPETIKKSIKVEKPRSAVKGKEEEENIFKRLSEISKAEKLGQVEKQMKSLKLTDKELKERIAKLKKELKVK